MEVYRNYNRNRYNQMARRDCQMPNANMQPACKNAPLAMAFVNMQEWCDIYNPDEALKCGTAFPSLNLIFCGVRGMGKC